MDDYEKKLGPKAELVLKVILFMTIGGSLLLVILSVIGHRSIVRAVGDLILFSSVTGLLYFMVVAKRRKT